MCLPLGLQFAGLLCEMSCVSAFVQGGSQAPGKGLDQGGGGVRSSL